MLRRFFKPFTLKARSGSFVGMSEYNAISLPVVAPDQNKSRAQLLTWLEESVRPPSLSSKVVFSHYQKSEQPVLKKILARMDRHEKDGRISLWEFFDAVDADGDGISTQVESARFLRGTELVPVYCAEFESESCYQGYLEWENEFRLIRSLVEYFQEPGLFGDRGIQIQNLNMGRKGKPNVSSVSDALAVNEDKITDDATEPEIFWSIESFDDELTDYDYPTDVNFCEMSEPSCDSIISPCDPEVCEMEDPDYEDRFTRYQGGDDEDELLEDSLSEDGQEDLVNSDSSEIQPLEIVEEEWDQWEEAFPNLKAQLENELNELDEIESAIEDGQDYDEERYQHLLGDSSRLAESLRGLVNNLDWSE